MSEQIPSAPLTIYIHQCSLPKLINENLKVLGPLALLGEFGYSMSKYFDRSGIILNKRFEKTHLDIPFERSKSGIGLLYVISSNAQYRLNLFYIYFLNTGINSLQVQIPLIGFKHEMFPLTDL
jgi:hypothetical protein